MATKTTFVVFKRHEPQSVAELSYVAGDPLIDPKSTQTQKVKNGDFLKILKSPKMSNFSTIFENGLWAPYMLLWIWLK